MTQELFDTTYPNVSMSPDDQMLSLALAPVQGRGGVRFTLPNTAAESARFALSVRDSCPNGFSADPDVNESENTITFFID